jgi:anthranilate phosphoribosyltransferase
MIKKFIAKLINRNDLSESEMEKAMNAVMSGKATPAQIAAFITALRSKGETIDEIAGAAKVMRLKASKICLHPNNKDETILDTCGTGGDNANTFNVSTASALVAAGGGIKVAKHGNRAVSSKCGSADVLEALGVKLDLTVIDVERCLREVGIGFLFAPLFHGAMKYAAEPRRDIGIRTIFNILGPLTNPAGATVQVLGVYASGLTEKIARVLGRLDLKEAFVVCGEGQFDEISICGPTRISHLKKGEVTTFEIQPEDYGLDRARPEDITGGDNQENANIINHILGGAKGPARDIVLFNAAAAFVVAGIATDLKDGLTKAADSIDSGRAREKLDLLIKFTQSCALV